jgi:energy-converting hydrogenase Eha subunit C
MMLEIAILTTLIGSIGTMIGLVGMLSERESKRKSGS